MLAAEIAQNLPKAETVAKQQEQDREHGAQTPILETPLSKEAITAQTLDRASEQAQAALRGVSRVHDISSTSSDFDRAFLQIAGGGGVTASGAMGEDIHAMAQRAADAVRMKAYALGEGATLPQALALVMHHAESSTSNNGAKAELGKQGQNPNKSADGQLTTPESAVPFNTRGPLKTQLETQPTKLNPDSPLTIALAEERARLATQLGVKVPQALQAVRTPAGQVDTQQSRPQAKEAATTSGPRLRQSTGSAPALATREEEGEVTLTVQPYTSNGRLDYQGKFHGLRPQEVRIDLGTTQNTEKLEMAAQANRVRGVASFGTTVSLAA